MFPDRFTLATGILCLDAMFHIFSKDFCQFNKFKQDLNNKTNCY